MNLCAQTRSEKEIATATKEFNKGVEAYNKADYNKADSLFTVAIRIVPFREAFYNRAFAKKELGKMKEYCNDLRVASYLCNDSSCANCCDMCTKKVINYFDVNNQLSNVNEYVFKHEIIIKKYDSLITVKKVKKDNDEEILLEYFDIKNKKDTIWYGGINKPLISKNSKVEKKIKESEDVFVKTDIMPTFPGGDDALMEYMQSTVNYPKMVKKDGISGTVYVFFCIDKDGYVCDVNVVRGVKNAEALDKEAAKAVLFMPRWTPGYQNEKSVKVQFTFPIKFKLR